MNTPRPLLGAHLSISGGFYKAIETAEEIGCTAIQIFTKSNRQWKAKPISTSDAQQFIEAQKKSCVKIVVAHASYLINLGSANKETRDKSLAALIEEIKRCNTLNIPFLVLHPGTAEPGQEDTTAKDIGKLINQALLTTPECTTSVLVETMAGQGKSIGHTFEKLAMIISQVQNQSRIGVCFDTCHAFAAGYSFESQDDYKSLWAKFDATIGIDKLQCIHMNNSKKEQGAKVDRHEHIDAGKININAFAMIMNDPQLKDIPKILETPKEQGHEEDLHNLAILKSLIQQ